VSFGPEWLIVIGIIVLIFGASQLPKLARSLGSAKGEFEKGLREGQTQSDETAADDTKKDDGAT
jgi:sec-independent protein translocase protein TatA